MQFGIPITIINGGISAMIRVNSKSKSAIDPIDQITVVITTRIQINTTRRERKKKKIREEVTNANSATKIYISSVTRFPITTRK